ncbi:ABC transporter ATP-binding protein [Enterovirga sp.]|uniref:ABC transporter ATP-binding protein n=1 Tax=Enterovirga sp. TaxID=2026350 RepID=UPI002614385B|nr:ABC transporter ATP-binding protein [Enterovirga sp.]MDB5591180.1 branched chain amino acid transporter ATP-binding protein [Enterovirga sp.]
MLELRDVHASYGKIKALHGVTITAPAGKVTSLLGANGAGKTTTMRVITGLLPATGSVVFDGAQILGLRPDRIVRRGLSMVPERRELFTEMTVGENLRLGAYTRSDDKEIRRDIEGVLDLFPRLRERFGQISATLSGGEQQMLTIARALMAKPKFLILDEPSLGLAPKLVDEIFDIIDRIRPTGMSMLLVEQNVRAALAVSDYAYLMETGEIRLSGTAAEIEADPSVQDAYLGT